MNWLDLIVLIPICWWGFKGFHHGLIYEVFAVLALILGFWVAKHFSFLLEEWLNIPLAEPIAFVIMFFLVLFLVHLAGKGMQKVVKIAIPEIVDHLLGLGFGICKVVLVVSILFLLFNKIDKKELLIKKETKEASVAYRYLEPIAPKILVWKDRFKDQQ
ncbi:MAG: CvpA family protein [Bacteroidales bacterium]|nr:CvpA family protein [Bacteroidales bacterium]